MQAIVISSSLQLADVQTLYNIEQALRAAASLRCKLTPTRALTLPW